MTASRLSKWMERGPWAKTKFVARRRVGDMLGKDMLNLKCLGIIQVVLLGIQI